MRNGFKYPIILGLTVTVALAIWVTTDKPHSTPIAAIPIEKPTTAVAPPLEVAPGAESSEKTDPAPAADLPEAPTEDPSLEVVSIRTKDLLERGEFRAESSFAESYHPIQKDLEFSADKITTYEIAFDQDLPSVAGIVILGVSGQTLISSTELNGTVASIGNQAAASSVPGDSTPSEDRKEVNNPTLFENDWIKADPRTGQLKTLRVSGRSKIPSESKVRIFMQILEDPK